CGQSQIRRPALFEVGVGNRQFRLSQILAIRIRIDERLHIEPADFLPAMLDVVHGLVVEDFVWLRVVVYARRFIDLFLLVENLRNLRVAWRRAQEKQRSENTERQTLASDT